MNCGGFFPGFFFSIGIYCHREPGGEKTESSSLLSGMFFIVVLWFTTSIGTITVLRYFIWDRTKGRKNIQLVKSQLNVTWSLYSRALWSVWFCVFETLEIRCTFKFWIQAQIYCSFPFFFLWAWSISGGTKIHSLKSLNSLSASCNHSRLMRE